MKPFPNWVKPFPKEMKPFPKEMITNLKEMITNPKEMIINQNCKLLCLQAMAWINKIISFYKKEFTKERSKKIYPYRLNPKKNRSRIFKIKLLHFLFRFSSSFKIKSKQTLCFNLKNSNSLIFNKTLNKKSKKIKK